MAACRVLAAHESTHTHALPTGDSRGWLYVPGLPVMPKEGEGCRVGCSSRVTACRADESRADAARETPHKSARRGGTHGRAGQCRAAGAFLREHEPAESHGLVGLRSVAEHEKIFLTPCQCSRRLATRRTELRSAHEPSASPACKQHQPTGWTQRCDHESGDHLSSAPSIFSRLRRPCHARHVTAHRKI